MCKRLTTDELIAVREFLKDFLGDHPPYEDTYTTAQLRCALAAMNQWAPKVEPECCCKCRKCR